jgi:protein-S-isoprenylcysteine O-methyltransferase Ste14
MAFRTKRKDLFFVGIQVLFFVVYVYIPAFLHPSANDAFQAVGLALLMTGIVIVSLGLFSLRKTLTPFPSVRRDGVLVTNGIYRFIRHPIYTGIMMVLAGYGLYSAHAGKLVIVVFLAILFYFKSVYEEQMLGNAYPGYEEYRRRTGRFLPRLKNIGTDFWGA